MDTIVLRLNILLATIMTFVVSKSAYDSKQGFVRVFTFPWVWLLAFSTCILENDESSWHLFWVWPVSLLIGGVLNLRINAERFSRIAIFLPETSRSEFVKLAKRQAELALALQQVDLSQNISTSVSFDLSVASCSAGEKMISNGNREPGFSSLLLALQFDQENPLAWANLAEAKIVICDRISARWATKLLIWKPHTEMSYKGWKIYSSTDGQEMLCAMKVRMKEIVDICQDHPEWIDSSVWLMPDELKR